MIPKTEDTGTKIRACLNSPKIALQLLKEDYSGKRIPKDFIKMAEEDIDNAVNLSKGFKANKSVKFLTAKQLSKLLIVAKENPENLMKIFREEFNKRK